MTQRTRSRLRALLLATGLTAVATATVAVPPAAAAPDAGRPSAALPAPCTPPPPVRATTTKDADDAAGVTASDARRARVAAAHPDRTLSAYSGLNQVGEGWRYTWTGGTRRDVAFLNRQGAMLVGSAFAPDPARCPGPRPAVLVAEGITANEVLYWWQAQSLAEAGYVVLAFDYMNQGLSEAHGRTADGTPVPPLCADTACARGSDPATGFLQDAQDALDFLLSSPEQPYARTGPVLPSDAPFDAAFPFAAQVDRRVPVGLTGHSEGARVVSVLQGLDERVGAVVALDNLASRLKGDPGSSNSQCVEGGIGTDVLPVVPRVPAMGQAAPNNPGCMDPELKKFAYEKWRAAGVPAVQVVVAGSQHGDWGPNPSVREGNASVPELAAFWTVAWFDRWLLRDPAAEVRLLTRTFSLHDHYDGPVALTAEQVLDTTFTSSAETGTNSCLDLRAGCPVRLPVLDGDGRGERPRPGRSAAPAVVAAPPASVPAPAGDAAAVAPLAPAGLDAGPAVPGPLAVAAPLPVPVAATPFVPQVAGLDEPAGVRALLLLPLAGVLLGLGVLVGPRRHAALARRLGGATS